jgi:hypothetical protein
VSRRAVRLLLISAATVTAMVALASPGHRGEDQDRFPHQRHANLFPLCTTCHAGMVDTSAAIWPQPASCVACHDGAIKERVDWQPRSGPRASNLRFGHVVHGRSAAARDAAHSELGRQCVECHAVAGAERMAVQHAVVGRCLECHQLGSEHLGVADTACARCHFPLAEAPSLSRQQVAGFPEPPSHQRPGFALTGHADLAKVPIEAGRFTVAASCATCHARDFCITCHVNAPEVPAIQALAPDDRSLAIETELPVPSTHQRADWVGVHGREASRSRASCAACHAQESCVTCHVGSISKAVARLARRGPGRGPGVRLERAAPESHTWEFSDRHGPDAGARPSSCEGCHVRQDCLDCHRPSPGGGSGYHPDGFLARHPSSAYAREANCSDCHNPAQFCQSCHQEGGLTALRRLGPGGFHDAKRAFLFGHGQAARQQLESCASCHAERDCTSCHSAVGGGFRFNPHGPGFDPERMRRKNPSVCVACHGTAVPR